MLAKLVSWWMKRCRHSGENVAADIAEGCFGQPVRYCRRCGAVAIGSAGWRLPEPTWYRP